MSKRCGIWVVVIGTGCGLVGIHGLVCLSFVGLIFDVSVIVMTMVMESFIPILLF
jgi:hypothetical protein